jgi:hypothetical protein
VSGSNPNYPELANHKNVSLPQSTIYVAVEDRYLEGGMPKLTPVRRRLHIQAFSWTLYALQNAGLMMRSLDMESLMEAARRRTGLTNFGDIAFHEPLRRLLDSCRNEARLNSIGKLVYRELGHEFTAEAEGRMRSFLLRHLNGRYGNHSYAMASFGLDPVELDQGFTLYRKRFVL